MQLSVPYYSQYRDVTDPDWQRRSCGGVCFKMCMDFVAPSFETTVPSIPELIEEAVNVKAYTPSVGWVHRGMVFLAHNHGIPAYQEEFRSLDGNHARKLMERGFEKIVKTLNDGKPIIVSIEKGFKDDGSFHQIVIIGYEDEGKTLIYHEPESKDNTGKSRKIGKDRFLSHWRGFAIFVG